MLSYRHGYHAGNHADVLKHIVLCLILRSLNHKNKPYCVIDTHAASGIYSLFSPYANKICEYQNGAAKVLNNTKLQELVPEYYQAIKALNKNDDLKYYPGSPYFESFLSNMDDKLTFIDLHQSEHQLLLKNFGKDPRVKILHEDGFAALNALLPPMPRRALITIDPSYEMKNDYLLVVKSLKQALNKFATGIYAIWYPVLGRLNDHSKMLVQEIKHLNIPCLQAEIQVNKQEEEFGMCGSGMLILNYPYQLDLILPKVVKELTKALALDNEAKDKFRVLIPQP